ncbi:hypothetical protein Tco_0903616 [Tanacetum coccineum]
MMMGTKFNIEKFDGKNDFGLWHVRMKALLEQQGLAAALEELPTATIATYDNVIRKKAFSALILCLGKSQSEHIDEFHKLTLLYGRDTIKLEDVVATLNSKELQKMTEAKGDGGERLYVRGRSGQNRYAAGNEDQVSDFGDDGYENADVMMAMNVEELLD